MDAQDTIKTVTNSNSAIVPFDETGFVTFRDQNELRNAAAFLMQVTNVVPKHLTKYGSSAVMAALMTLKQRKWPVSAMNQMGWINDKITIYGSLYSATAETHPEFGEKREFFIDKEHNKICSENKNLNAEAWAAVVQIKKKGSKEWVEYYFTMDDAKKAGIVRNVWITYPRDMMMHKARKRAYDAEFASAVNGLLYHEDLVELEPETTRDVTATDDLNAELGA
jgi:hypothetical protein